MFRLFSSMERKVDQYRIISESKKGITAGCNNCHKEFEVKNDNKS